MSYLMLPDGIPNFTKAVISFWFRVPKASMDAAAAAWSSNQPAPPLNGVVPLVVIGPAGTNQISVETAERVIYRQEFEATIDNPPPYIVTTDVSTGPDSPPDTYVTRQTITNPNLGTYYWTNIRTDYVYVITTMAGPDQLVTDPTLIGVNCSPGSPPSLYVNVQTGQKASITWATEDTSITSQITYIGQGDISVSTTSVDKYHYRFGILQDVTNISYTERIETAPSPGDQTQQFSYVDTSSLTYNLTDSFSGDSRSIVVTPDVWHHVVVSFDLQTTEVHGNSGEGFTKVSDYVDSASHMWIALDDVNYTKADLSNDWPDGSNDQNAILTDSAYGIAGQSPGSTGNNPTYKLENPAVLSSGNQMGLPATPQFVNNIYRVELAEFVMWTGKTLDTGVEKNRRLFITAKNKNGEQFPVNQAPIMVPIHKYAVGNPAAWEPGADLPVFAPGLLDPSSVPSANKPLGVAEVDFTKCSFNWMMGRNLGKAKGKFVRTGKVKAYSPDPKLGGQ